MSLDTQKVGLAMASFMEHLESDYGEGTLIDVVICAEVHTPGDPDNDEEEGRAYVRTPMYCTNPSRVYQTGLLEWARDVSIGGEAAGDDE